MSQRFDAAASKAEMRRRLVEQVLEINPTLARGRTTEEVCKDLVGRRSSVPPSRRALGVLGEMLRELTAELEPQQQDIARRLGEIDGRQEALNQLHLRAIARFLADTQPTALSPGAREVLKKHSRFFYERLGGNVVTLTRLAAEAAR